MNDDFAVYDDYTNEIVTATVEVLDSNKYSVKVAGVQMIMSRNHLMNTLRDMDERATYEKRLAALQLTVAYCKPGTSVASMTPIVLEARELSLDIDSYVEARGEDLEEDLQEPMIVIREDLWKLGYEVCDGDAEMFGWIRDCENNHPRQK
jgi:hypothetical protein